VEQLKIVEEELVEMKKRIDALEAENLAVKEEVSKKTVTSPLRQSTRSARRGGGGAEERKGGR